MSDRLQKVKYVRQNTKQKISNSKYSLSHISFLTFFICFRSFLPTSTSAPPLPRRFSYPFIPVNVIPFTKCFCANRKTITMGIMTTTAAAI